MTEAAQDFKYIRLTIDSTSHVARITLDRPEKLNALSRSLDREIIAAIDICERDDDVKVVVFNSSTDRAFSTGKDLAEVGLETGLQGDGTRRPSQRIRLVTDHHGTEMYRRVFYCLKATVSVVKGYCLAGGFDLCMATDLQVVADDAVFGDPAERLVGPAFEVNTLLYLWKLGPTLAKELMFTGGTKTGAELADLKVLTKVVPASRVEEEAEKLIRAVALMPADGIVMGKAAFNLLSDFMGIGLGYRFGTMWHSYGTNIRFEPDEFNFFKERRSSDATSAIRDLNKFYDG